MFVLIVFNSECLNVYTRQSVIVKYKEEDRRVSAQSKHISQYLFTRSQSKTGKNRVYRLTRILQAVNRFIGHIVELAATHASWLYYIRFNLNTYTMKRSTYQLMRFIKRGSAARLFLDYYPLYLSHIFWP